MSDCDCVAFGAPTDAFFFGMPAGAFFFGAIVGAPGGGGAVVGGGGGNCADADTIDTAMARTVTPAQKREVLVMIYFSKKLALDDNPQRECPGPEAPARKPWGGVTGPGLARRMRTLRKSDQLYCTREVLRVGE